MDKLTARRLAIAIATVVGTLSVGDVALATNWAVVLQPGSAAVAQSQNLSAPSSVTASCTAPNQQTIIVSWTAVAHASSYSVYQSTTSATTGYVLTKSGATATSWTTGTLSTGKQYWYEVTATVSTNWVSVRSAATGSTTISKNSCSQP